MTMRIVSGACAAALLAAAEPYLLPGDGRLAPPPLTAAATQRFAVTRRAPADSADRPLSAVTRAERTDAVDARQAVLTFAWEPPYDSRDSLVVVRGTLAPVRERLVMRGVVREYAFDGAHVTGRMQRADSSWDAYGHTFPVPVFAFNEVELLVRSLRYARGLEVVAPLFSEVDRALEYDTLTVVGRGAPVGRDSTWVVRFADPAIVSLYTIDSARREIAGTEVTQRRGGAVLRYVRRE
jgi:hypothetical protein